MPLEKVERKWGTSKRKRWSPTSPHQQRNEAESKKKATRGGKEKRGVNSLPSFFGVMTRGCCKQVRTRKREKEKEKEREKKEGERVRFPKGSGYSIFHHVSLIW